MRIRRWQLRGTIELTKTEYEAIRSTANRLAIVPNHENPEAEVVVSECSRFAEVDKIEGCALSVALETDPPIRPQIAGAS